MSYLAEQILRLIEQHTLTQKRVAEKAGLSQPHLSDILNSKPKTVDPGDVAKIANAVSENVDDRALVMSAYLRDSLYRMKPEAAADAWEKIHLSSNGEHAGEENELGETLSKLRPNVATAVRRLVHVASRDQNAGDILINLASVVESGTTDSPPSNT